MTIKALTTSMNINQNQLLAAQLLATGKSGKAVAEAVGVTEETVSRWKQDNNFKIYLMELSIEAHEVARNRLRMLVDKAVANVENVLDDQTLSAKNKFDISIKILELCNGDNYRLKDYVSRLRSPLSAFDF